jgi:hypothetical protein
MQRRLLALALVVALSGAAACAAGDSAKSVDGVGQAALTIYHADNDALFSGDAQSAIDAGRAVVHEQRSIDVQSGRHTLRIGGLPASVEPEAVTVNFGNGVDVLGRRIVLARGSAGSALSGQIGEHVKVAGNSGQTIAEGELLGADENGLTVRDANGGVIVVHDYATVSLPPNSVSGGGSVLLDVDAKSSGTREAKLSYSTSGVGWRAAYDALLASGSACRMHFDPQASIANRSSRDYDAATIKLVAGQPNLANQPPVYGSHIRRMDMAATAAAPMPKQSSLGDYRTYTLPGAADLPDGTVTLTPLYASSDLNCTRQYLLEAGNVWQPPKPLLDSNYNNDSYQDQPVASTLLFEAPDALPAGTLRAKSIDHDGTSELLGEGDIPDTPKGQQVKVTLGESFNLRASRERTAFSVDKGAHTMDEAFRITLTNGGDTARTVTEREHPNRWSAWKLLSSSIQPDKQTPDTLEFAVNVPVRGKAVLDYRVQYTWLAKDE